MLTKLSDSDISLRDVILLRSDIDFVGVILASQELISLREILVGPSGLEPPTSCLSGTRSNHLSYEPLSGGGPVAVLRPYSVASFPFPRPFCRSWLSETLWVLNLFMAAHPRVLVEMMGFEPMTPCLQGRCSPN